MLKLWGRPTSGRTQKVLWTLAEIGLSFEFIMASAAMGPAGHVSKGNKPFGVVDTLEYALMNPNRRIPTIDDDGFVLWESNSIVRYLALQYAPELLYQRDIKTFASSSRWLDWENNELLPPQHELVMHAVRLPENERNATVLEKARQDFVQRLHIMEEQLARTRYICGEHFTYGDIGLGLRVHRWKLFRLEQPSLPNVERWYGLITARPAFHVWTAQPEHHLEG
jgi:glutathione S-transferase